MIEEKLAFIPAVAFDNQEIAQAIESEMDNSAPYGNYMARAYSVDNEQRLIDMVNHFGYTPALINDPTEAIFQMELNAPFVILVSAEASRVICDHFVVETS